MKRIITLMTIVVCASTFSFGQKSLIKPVIETSTKRLSTDILGKTGNIVGGNIGKNMVTPFINSGIIGFEPNAFIPQSTGIQTGYLNTGVSGLANVSQVINVKVNDIVRTVAPAYNPASMPRVNELNVFLQKEPLTQETITMLVEVRAPVLFTGEPHTYEKFARVEAREAQEGEKIVTQVKDGTIETTNIAHSGDWIITNPGGEQYIIPGDKFAKKYVPATELGEGWYKPAGGPQSFLQIKQDITLIASWGEEQHLKAGAYLNITNPGDIYGVAEIEFHQTYKLVK